MADDRGINLNELPPSDDLMALAIIPPKELAVVLPKEIIAASSKEIVLVHQPQSYYARAVPCLTFRVPKELNLLPPKPNEMLIELKTNKFGDVTCMKYKSSTPRLTLDGVRALPDQIKVAPPWKRSSSSSPSSREPKHSRTTIA